MCLKQDLTEKIQSKEQIKEEIKRLLYEEGAYYQNRIDIDKVWSSYDTVEKFAKLISDYIKLLPIFTSIKKLAFGINIKSALGCIPFASLISIYLKKDFAVWREHANIRTGSSRIYGEIGSKDCFLFLHDVTVSGSTIIKAVHDLLSEKKARLGAVITIVDTNKGADEYVKKKVKEIIGVETQFHAILTLSDFEEDTNG